MERPEFHRLAERELNEAAQYYDGEEPGLGPSFLQEVNRCLQSIAIAWKGYNDMECELMRISDEETAIAWCVERFGDDGSGFFAAADFKLAEPDEAFFSDEQIALKLAPARAEAFRQAVIGYAQDIVIQEQP